MLMPLITPYAALLALLYLYLSVHTVALRRRLKIRLGAGKDDALLRATRAHANFAEYVPLSLILLSVLEYAETGGGIMPVLGWILVFSRVAHAYGLLVAEPAKDSMLFRQLGMMGTFAVIAASAGLLLFTWGQVYFGFGSV